MNQLIVNEIIFALIKCYRVGIVILLLYCYVGIQGYGIYLTVQLVKQTNSGARCPESAYYAVYKLNVCVKNS